MTLSAYKTSSLAGNDTLKSASEALSTLLDQSQALTPKEIQSIMDAHFGAEAWEWRDDNDLRA